MVIPFIFALAAACAPRPARCSCFPPPEPKTPAEARAYVEPADEAFVGRVVDVDASSRRFDRAAAEQEHWSHVAVTLVVTSRWRGAHTDTVVVHTSSLAEMCGMSFSLGADYFVMASRTLAGAAPQTARLGVWTCGQSRPATQAKKLLALLGSPAPR